MMKLYRLTSARWRSTRRKPRRREEKPGEFTFFIYIILVYTFMCFLEVLIPLTSGISHGLWIRMRRSVRRARLSSAEEPTSR